MELNKEQIIKEIKRVASRKGVTTLTWLEFCSATGISRHRIQKIFDGWREACKLAGLQPNYDSVKIDDNTLFKEMERVFLGQNRICTSLKFVKLSKYSITPYRGRFGKWENILIEFRKWLENNKIDFKYINDLPSKSEKNTFKSENNINIKSSAGIDWQSKGGTTYGSFLNFRGLLHAPLNEQGVVFLFGMICKELGIMVESIRTGYPDCEAKRCINKNQDKWEKVTIEFEFASSNFKGYGHNPKDCNIIVCWEHDWQECPIEVIELKSAIKSLQP